MLNILHHYVSPHSVHGLGTRVIRGTTIVGTHINRANSTKIPSPRIDPGERPTGPGWRGKEGAASGIKNKEGAQSLGKKNPRFVSLAPHDGRQARVANDRSGISAAEGRLRDTAHRTDQAGDRDASGDVARGQNTEIHRRSVLLRTTQQPRKRKQRNDDHDNTPRAARPPARSVRRSISRIGSLVI